jgi:activating signal cointegrator complex subunit 3
VEDSANEHVYHAETWLLTKKMMRERAHRLSFTIPIFEPLPSQYYIRCARPAVPLLLGDLCAH